MVYRGVIYNDYSAKKPDLHEGYLAVEGKGRWTSSGRPFSADRSGA